MTDKLKEMPAEDHWPMPTGYRILLAMPEVVDRFDSGILKAHQTAEYEQAASVLGLVLIMGPDCYKEKEKFPYGPWCSVGDYVLIGAYRGTRLKINGYEFRIVDDVQIEAVIPKDSVGKVLYSRV